MPPEREDDGEKFGVPSQMMDAPNWALFLFTEMRRSQSVSQGRDIELDFKLFKLDNKITSIDAKFGCENAEGTGGTGFVGELKRVAKDLESIKSERNFLRGIIATFIAAGSILIYGFIAWVRSIVSK